MINWNVWRTKGALRGSGSHFGCIHVELQAQSLLIKQSSLVDNIIEVCVYRSGEFRLEYFQMQASLNCLYYGSCGR